jgi:multicomponent Na+:H+ antiporter subunit B
VVIFSAGIAVMLMLGLVHGNRYEETGTNLVLWVVVKPFIALIMLFALYVQMHGDFGAGGGFQAGVIFAAGMILYGLVYGGSAARRVVPPDLLPRLAALGVLIYAGTGLASVFKGYEFLDYNALSADPVSGQHLGILLVEAGVGITVFSTVLLIFYALSGRGVKRRE